MIVLSPELWSLRKGPFANAVRAEHPPICKWAVFGCLEPQTSRRCVVSPRVALAAHIWLTPHVSHPWLETHGLCREVNA